MQQLHFNSQLLLSEMKKRGIQVKILPGSTLIEATHWNHAELIEWTDLSIMPSVYKLFFDSKRKTKILLKKHGFSISPWIFLEWNELNKALIGGEKLWFPLVLKPEFWTHGYAVRMNIDSTDELKSVLESLSEEISYWPLVLEKQFPWNEYRITVTKNWFFWAVYRYMPSVTWNGVNTIWELVEIENTKRSTRKNALCRIFIDHEAKRFLAKKWYTIDSIPKKWQIIILRSNSNVSTGWGCIDVTDWVHPFFKQIAGKILSDFSWLPYIWIDVITKDITKKWKYIICELNPSPWISLHTHPEKWTSRDLQKYLIDLLFPETIE
jgi:cyanophycin synthetase